MENRILRTILGGIVGSAFLTIINVFLAPIMGVKINLATMLVNQTDIAPTSGWFTCTMIGVLYLVGILFAFAYLFLFREMVTQIGNIYLKGFIYGIVVFLIAELGMILMGDEMKMMTVIVLLLSHLVYAITVVKIINE